MSTPDPYLLGYRQAEQERLEEQSHQLADESDWLFEQIGIREGWRVVEIGCGPRGCLGLLSKRVGASGRVVGVERSTDQVQRARQFLSDSQLMNVEVLDADARATALPDKTFDLATARLVLVNVPRPEEIVAEMIRLLKPGGVIALHEPDSTTQRCDPPLAAQTRLLQVLNAYAETNGIDRSIGLRTPRMLRDLGLTDVRVNPLVHVYPLGHPRRMLLIDFVENARSRILEKGLIAQAELDGLMAALRQHLMDPATLVISSLFLQTWGRMPDR